MYPFSHSLLWKVSSAATGEIRFFDEILPQICISSSSNHGHITLRTRLRIWSTFFRAKICPQRLNAENVRNRDGAMLCPVQGKTKMKSSDGFYLEVIVVTVPFVAGRFNPEEIPEVNPDKVAIVSAYCPAMSCYDCKLSWYLVTKNIKVLCLTKTSQTSDQWNNHVYCVVLNWPNQGKPYPSKTDDFLEKFQGGGGHFQSIKKMGKVGILS